MKKRFIIEWIIAILILVLVIPFLIVRISSDGEELFTLYRYNIRFIAPAIIIILIISQIWRKRKKSDSMTTK